MILRYRLAKPADCDQLGKLLKLAIEQLASQGIPQWQEGQFRQAEIKEAIEKGTAYVLYPKDDREKVAAFMILEDYDENYEREMEEGQFKHSGPYLALHRMMLHPDYQHQGLAFYFFVAAEEVAKNLGIRLLRIDTHARNLPMQQVIKRQGFTYCGQIRLSSDHTLRLAYEKELSLPPDKHRLSGGRFGSMEAEEMLGKKGGRAFLREGEA